MSSSLIELKNSLPDLDLNPGQLEPSARQSSRHCGVAYYQWFSSLSHRGQANDAYLHHQRNVH